MVSNVQILLDSVNQYVVRPVNAFGLGGFVFDIEGETKVDLSTEITDHFLEDNSTIQDHIAIKPKKITLKSFVGELTFRQDDETETFVQRAVRKLTTVAAYAPPLTQAAQQALNAREALENIDFDTGKDAIKNLFESRSINRLTDYWAAAKNIISGSRQQQAFMYFKALMEQKILVSLQTPFEFVNNMAIESITAIQDESSRYISDFSITLKQMRFATILNVPRGSSRYVTDIAPVENFTQTANRTTVQQAVETRVGNVPGTDLSLAEEQLRQQQAARNAAMIYEPAAPLPE